ncbi:MAG: bifunctional nuclease family protein [Planctomycetota bacterium]
MVEMVLHRILFSETTDQQYIYLKEKEGDRSFPIVIGFNEAQAIHRFVNQQSVPRPQTHDLMTSMVAVLGARLSRVEITNLKDSTFYAVLHLVAADGRVAEVDARPSDAIALATAVKAPIFAAEAVIEESAAA